MYSMGTTLHYIHVVVIFASFCINVLSYCTHVHTSNHMFKNCLAKQVHSQRMKALSAKQTLAWISYKTSQRIST